MSLSETKQVGTIAALIKERRTIRDFKQDPVSDELLLELLNVAVWAPNHGNRQPWRFILYKGDGRKALADAMLQTYDDEEMREKHGIPKWNDFMKIPAHLVVILKEDTRQKQWDEDYGAVCALIQNFQLAAWEQGLGVVWKTNNYNYELEFQQSVGLQADEKIVGLLNVGYPASVPKVQPRKSVEEMLTIIDSQ
ncbi:nitroreductase [Paenibacillus qinlingensis]|uniref:Putative NAD(P)H nitroreductase n=1 Tax=Paenibacillus qinlingensis TaxID=1837343 RepID=A0ABU1NXL8_9BACL|nr:nitroreductase [Paenibacillus qinlingensis]MDR6551587.1 nitroreductase [Paenibacillus qinlingensis]